MNIVGFILLYFMNFLIEIAKSKYNVGEFDTSTFKNIVENASGLYNIFAWVNEFVPVSFLISLALLTTVFYGYKLIVGITKYIISIFKK